VHAESGASKEHILPHMCLPSLSVLQGIFGYIKHLAVAVDLTSITPHLGLISPEVSYSNRMCAVSTKKHLLNSGCPRAVLG
jgi:hypothetical protein